MSYQSTSPSLAQVRRVLEITVFSIGKHHQQLITRLKHTSKQLILGGDSPGHSACHTLMELEGVILDMQLVLVCIFIPTQMHTS